MARVTGHIGLDPTLEPAHGRPRSRLVPAFRGWSTVVLTSGRMAGICPRGDAVAGPVDFERGTAVAWSFPLRHVDAAGVVDAGGGQVVAVRSTDRLVGGVMLAAAHRVVDGGLNPSPPRSWPSPSTPPPGAGPSPAAGVAGRPWPGGGRLPPVELNRPRARCRRPCRRSCWPSSGCCAWPACSPASPSSRPCPTPSTSSPTAACGSRSAPWCWSWWPELGLVAGACFLLAWQLSQGDAVARVVAIVVAGSLAFGLLVGDGLDDAVGHGDPGVLGGGGRRASPSPPRARDFFADRPAGERPPAPVVAAEAVVVVALGRPARGRRRLPAAGVGEGAVRRRRPGHDRRLRGLLPEPAAAGHGRSRGPDPGVGADGGRRGGDPGGGRRDAHRAPVHPPRRGPGGRGLLWLPPRARPSSSAAGRWTGGADPDDDDEAYDDVADQRRYTDFADYVDHDPGGGPRPRRRRPTPPPPPFAVAGAGARGHRPSPFEPGPAAPPPPPPTSRPAPPLPPPPVRVPRRSGPVPPAAAAPAVVPAPPRGPRGRDRRPRSGPRPRRPGGCSSPRRPGSGRPSGAGPTPGATRWSTSAHPSRRAPGRARARHPVRHHVVVPRPRGPGAGPGGLPGLDGDVRGRAPRHRLPGDLDPARHIRPAGGRVRPR